MTLIAELKRRKVFKVGAAYLVVAWLLIQVVSTVAPQLNLPEWAPRLITFVLLLGFPVALVLAWIFDNTPEGVRVDAAPVGNKRVFAIAAALAALAVGWYWKGRPAVEELGAEARTIAVLPFVNMSGDPDNEYFSDGISEEILNVLASTPELRVAARTSSFAFKGQAKEIPDIARELEVRMVLEGSVRRQGDRVRITAQLIDAQKGFHLWSQTYDRELKDIFAIQGEIARAIGDQLKVRIGGAQAQDAPSTATGNVEAYDLYLRGLAQWQLRREQSLWDAAALFERSLAADPDFAPAHAGLALVYTVVDRYSARITTQESQQRARDHAEQALALDPASPEAFAALGNIAIDEGRRDTARRLFQRAIALRPSFATAHQWLGTSLMTAGELEAGLASLQRSAELDPRSLVTGHNQLWALLALGREAEARAACERVLAFVPEYSACLDTLALMALLRGELDVAEPLLQRYAAAMDLGDEPLVKELIDAFAGRGDRDALAQRLVAGGSNASDVRGRGALLFAAETPALLVALDHGELALDFLERLGSESGDDLDWAIVLPALDPIRCDPRFVALVERRKIRDPHWQRVCAQKS
jgi:TolB-like protein/Flp pilus assembly protein TadD